MQPISTSAATRQERALTVLAALLLALCLLILLKPYSGIRHDSVLYFGQALLTLHPEEFKSDLFFAYGSQAQFTVFPRLLAQLMGHFTPEAVSIGLIIAGLAAFLAATWFLLGELLPARYRYWGLLAVLVMPPSYGALGVFAYAEPFVTGRTFAEPLLLLALALVVRQRWLWAAFAFVLAASTHPLQAAPAFVLAWVLACQKDRRLWHLAWLAIPVALLGLFGVGPFVRLQEVHDPQWLSWIVEPNQHVFLALWPPGSWIALGVDVLVLWLARERAQGVLRRWIDAMLLAGGLCFAAAAILGDGLHLVVPTGLQLWRVHWLIKWTAMALVPFLGWEMWRDPAVDRMRLYLLFAAVVLGTPMGRFAAPMALVLIVPLFFAWPRIAVQVTPPVRKLLALALAGAVAIVYAKFVFFVMGRHMDNPSAPYGLLVTVLHPLPLGLLLLWAVPSWASRTSRAQIASVALLVLAIGLSLAGWDRRSNWNRYVEQANYDTNPFGVSLKPGAQVYWINELLTPWLVLRRASFWNGHQEAGLLFNRGTAEEALRREKIFTLLEFQNSICMLQNAFEKNQDKCAPDEEAVKTVCEEAKGRMEYLVLPHRLNYGILGSWHIPQRDSLDRAVTYYLYQCSDFAPRAVHSGAPEKLIPPS